jgi:hypothetical protein
VAACSLHIFTPPTLHFPLRQVTREAGRIGFIPLAPPLHRVRLCIFPALIQK